MTQVNHWFGAKTEFSLGESILAPASIIELAADHGYESVSVADTNSVSALVSLYKSAKKLESPIKVNIGATFKVVDSLEWRRPKRDEKKTKNLFFMPSLHAKNDQGVADIMSLLSLSNDADHFYYTAQISLEEFCEVVAKGNVVPTTGGVFSLFQHSKYSDKLTTMAKHFSLSELRYELIPVNTAYYDRVNAIAAHRAIKSASCCVVSRPTFYRAGEDNLRNTMNCILSRDEVSSMWRNEPQSKDLHMMTAEDLNGELNRMIDRLVHFGLDREQLEDLVASSIVETNRLGTDLDYTWAPKEVCLPHMAGDPFAQLVADAREGWRKRIDQPVLGYKPDKSLMDVYRQRLKYELSVLRKMKFEEYFLLVQKIVKWAKANDITVGPGRGSVGGSLIAYLLNITDIDPIRFGLIFERFINPDRIDLPDADLDFMSSRRGEVVQWLIDTYGQENVCGISNYGELGSASALRSVSKAHGLKEDEYACSKLIPKDSGTPAPLEEAMCEVPSIEQFALDHPDIWQEAIGLQGVFRNYGQHAAGVVVAGEPIINRAVVETRTGGSVCNWDKRVVEEWGLIKLDILGLSNLDVLNLASRYIETKEGKRVDYTALPLDDPKVLKAFGRGDTTGVFQFESGGMRQLLKNLASQEPLKFEDITAATALYRPGPMQSGLLDQYVNIKQGILEPSYPHPATEEALKETEGVMVYQEQIMQIARDLAGFTMAEADLMRKAIGKKDMKLMNTMRQQFVDGAVSKGMTVLEAEDLFGQIEKFAAYSFNKSHSVEYTVISYWTMWLKTYHPAEFYAACLTVLPEEKLMGLVRDAEKRDVYVVPPDINKSSRYFEIDYDAAREQRILYTPFQRVKGLSDKSCEAIMEARDKAGPFASKDEFLDAVDKRRCNKRVQAALDAVGAFAEIEEQTPARHPDRLKDQKQLMPGLVADQIKADRKLELSPHVLRGIKSVVEDAQTACADYAGMTIVNPTFGGKKPPKFMVVSDSPNWSEEREGNMIKGNACSDFRMILKEAGLKVSEGYFTSLSKMKKPGQGQLPNSMINAFGPLLDREIDLLRPPVILALGSAASRYLAPGVKGSYSDLCGTTHYDAKIDATVVFGMNPGILHFRPEEADKLMLALEQVFDLIN